MTRAPSDSASPFVIVMGSTLLAALALVMALWLTRSATSDPWQAMEHLTITPERAAESFIEAYRSGSFERAAHLATGKLATSMRTRTKPGRHASTPRAESFFVQESHRLDDRHLRLVGVLVTEGKNESEGRSVSLTLVRNKRRYLVEEIQWASNK